MVGKKHGFDQRQAEVSPRGKYRLPSNRMALIASDVSQVLHSIYRIGSCGAR